MKTKHIILGATVILVGILSIAAPWGIGKFIESEIIARVETLKQTYPRYNITLKAYKRNVYSSSALFELTENITYPTVEKTLVHTVLEETILHGPVVVDFNNKKIDFVLAKIFNQIKFFDNDFITFDQKAISSTITLNYTGKAMLLTPIEKISGKIMPPHLANNSKQAQSTESVIYFELNGIHANADFSFGRNSRFPSHTIFIKEIEIENEARTIQIIANNIDLQSTTKGISKLFADHQIKIASVKAKHLQGKWALNGVDMHLSLEPVSETYTFKITNQFQTLDINNVIYGPSQFDMDIKGFPIACFSAVENINNLHLDKNKKGEAIINEVNKTEMTVEMALNTFKLQLPGGEFSVNGHFNYISKLHNNKMDHSASQGKLIAHFSKNAVVDLYKSLFVGTDDNIDDTAIDKHIQGIISQLGIVIDTGDHYESYQVFKDNHFYINGASYFDSVTWDNNARFKHPLTPENELLIAVWQDDTRKVEQLLQKDVNLITVHPERKNALQAAALQGSRDIVHLLLEHKAPIDQGDYRGATALYWAARNGHLALVEDLLKKGANPNLKTKDGWTALQEAAENGHKELVTILLASKADINATDHDKRTALYCAAKNGHNDIIRLLLDKSADPTIINIRGLSPADIARKEGHKNTANLLKEAMTNF